MGSSSSSKRPWFRRVNAPLLAALAATLLCALVYSGHRSEVLEVPGLNEWEQRSSDLRFRLRGHTHPKDDRIVIVGLDDKTRSEMPWLWQNRRGFAQLIRKLDSASPRAIGIDAFFASPESNLSSATVAEVRAARRSLENTADLSPAAQAADKALAMVDEETRGDAVLAETVSESKVLVLGILFNLGGPPLPPGTPERLGADKARVDESVYLDQPGNHRPPRASGLVAPLRAIAAVASHMGHVNVQNESDGAVRRAPLVFESGGRFYQSLSLKLASLELGQSTSYVSGDSFVSIGTKKIPLDAQTYGRISYLGPNKTFPRISVTEVMNTEGPHPALHDKIVLVGYTDTARDKIITPLEQQFDGVELHATLVHNMLHDELIREAGPWSSLFVIGVLGGFLALLQLRRIRKRGAWILGVGALILFLAYAIVAHLLFAKFGLLIEVMAPLLSALVITLTALTTSLATEGREKAELRSAFGQYLQSTLVERLIQDPARLRLGGQRRELTVLFSDIRGFSRFSEGLEPEVLSDFLNEYLTPMTELVMQDSGMLDKYIGDAVMAVYGAPLTIDDHATRACGTALSMLDALAPLNKSWQSRGLPEIHIGIGINTGTMSVGNMGSQRRFDYTVMGDAVNLGARLESLTKTYRVDVLVGEATMQAAKDNFVFREVDRVRVIGRSAAASVYELCGTTKAPGLSAEERALFARGLGAYREQDWIACTTILGEFLEAHPDDGPSQTLLERVPQLQAENLPASWDGVFAQRSK